MVKAHTSASETYLLISKTFFLFLDPSVAKHSIHNGQADALCTCSENSWFCPYFESPERKS